MNNSVKDQSSNYDILFKELDKCINDPDLFEGVYFSDLSQEAEQIRELRNLAEAASDECSVEVLTRG